MVDARHLVADEVGDEEDGEDRDPGIARQRVEGLGQVHDVEPVEDGAHEQRQVGVQAGGAGQA